MEEQEGVGSEGRLHKLVPRPAVEVEILKCGDRSVCFGDWRGWGVSDPMQLTKARTAQGKSDRTFPLALLWIFIAWFLPLNMSIRPDPVPSSKKAAWKKEEWGSAEGPA